MQQPASYPNMMQQQPTQGVPSATPAVYPNLAGQTPAATYPNMMQQQTPMQAGSGSMPQAMGYTPLAQNANAIPMQGYSNQSSASQLSYTSGGTPTVTHVTK